MTGDQENGSSSVLAGAAPAEPASAEPASAEPAADAAESPAIALEF